MNSLEQQISDFFEPLKKSLTAIQNTRGEIPEQRITDLRTMLRKNTATAYVMLSNTISNPQERQQLQDNLIETYCDFYDVLHKLNLEIVGGSEAVLDDPSLYKKRAETELPRIFKEFPQTNQKDTKDDKQAIQDLTNAIQNIKILPPAPTLKPVIPGSQNGFKASVHEDRIAKVIAFLDENNIKHGDPQKGQAPAQNEMREESYALITIYNQDNQAIGEIAVNDYSGQAVFVWAPPQDKEFLSNNKKILQDHRKGIEPIDGVTYIERIPFDKKGEWKITLYDSIRHILTMPDTAIEAPSSSTAVTNDGPKRSKAENRMCNDLIIRAFLDHPEATAEALRKAFTEAFGKPASKITDKDLKRKRPVTITLPDETQVTVHSEPLYHEFLRQECQSLLCILQNKQALTKYSGPKIINCLRQDRKATQKAICDAVENVKDVFPTDKDNKPIITRQVIEAKNPLLTITKDPLLTITLPTRENVEIYMGALAKLLRNQRLPSLINMLGNPKAARQSANGQLITDLLDLQKRGPIIGRIKEQLPTGDLSHSDDPISFKINDLYDWNGTIGQLYYTLKNNHKKNPKIIPTLTQIRDDTYQKTAADAAASGTPPQAPEIDPTYTILTNANMDRQG